MLAVFCEKHSGNIADVLLLYQRYGTVEMWISVHFKYDYRKVSVYSILDHLLHIVELLSELIITYWTHYEKFILTQKKMKCWNDGIITEELGRHTMLFWEPKTSFLTQISLYLLFMFVMIRSVRILYKQVYFNYYINISIYYLSITHCRFATARL